MKINFVGNYGTGYVGESSDEGHITREIEELGHKVNRIPRDIWKAYCDGHSDPNWEKYLANLKSDINIIAKWSHFDSDRYVNVLQEESQAPCFYWLWDYTDWKTEYMNNDWHRIMAKSADLYLTNEGGDIPYMEKAGVKAIYFPFDVSDGNFDRTVGVHKIYDLVFFGSHVGKGDRIEWLTEINKTHPVTIFSWNHEVWKKQGFIDVYPAVYGSEFAYKVCQSKIIIGFSIEPNCWGYWSNRVGKVLTTGGFLLYQYAPGMELFLRDGAEYFSSIQEAKDKIGYYLEYEQEREMIAERGYKIGRDRFTSQARIKELLILIKRHLKGGLR